jgi:Putative zinc-finger
MNHPEEALAAYVDGVATLQERASVEAHLAFCPRCREDIERARAAKDAVASLPEMPAPEGTAAAVLAAAAGLGLEPTTTRPVASPETPATPETPETPAAMPSASRRLTRPRPQGPRPHRPAAPATPATPRDVEATAPPTRTEPPSQVPAEAPVEPVPAAATEPGRTAAEEPAAPPSSEEPESPPGPPAPHVPSTRPTLAYRRERRLRLVWAVGAAAAVVVLVGLLGLFVSSRSGGGGGLTATGGGGAARPAPGEAAGKGAGGGAGALVQDQQDFTPKSFASFARELATEARQSTPAPQAALSSAGTDASGRASPSTPRDQALVCLQRGTGLVQGTATFYVERASYGGEPVYIGAFVTSADGGRRSLLVIAVTVDGCQARQLVHQAL